MKDNFFLYKKNTLLTKVSIQNTFFKKLKGLMFKNKEETKIPLFFPNCNNIHTCFMRFPIDIIYLKCIEKKKDKNLFYYNGIIVKLIQNLKPWRISYCYKADSAIEFNSYIGIPNMLNTNQTVEIKNDI